MSRPDDHRGRIGAATSPTKPIRSRDRDTSRSSRFEAIKEPGKSRLRASPPRRDILTRPRPPVSKEGPIVQICTKVSDFCTVQSHVIRDAPVHEHDNFFEFVKKLVESINVSLKTKYYQGSFTEKEIHEFISRASKDESIRFATKIRNSHNAKLCQMGISGLPRSIFVGNGFGTERTAAYSAAKDLVDKLHRIGFISKWLYDVIAQAEHFDHSRRLPEYRKTLECFVALERCLFDPQGRLLNEWPGDLMEALDQPPQLFDNLSEKFKKIIKNIFGSGRTSDSKFDSGLREEKKSTAEDDIERKIAKQREDIMRRERAREMIEPLDDEPRMMTSSGAAPMLQQMQWNVAAAAAAAGMRAPALSYGMPMTMPGYPAVNLVPPVGVVNPISRGNNRDVVRPVDMDIDEHPYGRGNSPSRRRRRGSSHEERKRREEAERIKKKEEELERKMEEERRRKKGEDEERRKRDIEAEVQRRLQEELAKRGTASARPGYAHTGPSHAYGGANYGQPVSRAPPPASEFDQDMDEIHRLVKETENRLRTLAEQEFDNGNSSMTLRTLATLGESASEMDTSKRRDLISELRNILGHTAGRSMQHRPGAGDSWLSGHQQQRENRLGFQRDEPSSSSYYNRSSTRDYRDTKSRSCSRSRSPRERSPRGRGRDSRRDYDERDHDRAGHLMDSQSAQECAFCSSLYHSSDLCHLCTSPAMRKLELKKAGRCQSCLKRHSGSCYVPACDYCNGKGHHRSICDHLDHIRKLAALRDLAKP